MGDSLQVDKPLWFVTSHSVQLNLLPSAGRKMSWPKCGDALQLGSKGRYGSFHLWINRVAVGPERTGMPFRFFFGQPEWRSGSFLYKNSSQQCIRKCYLNSGGLQKLDDLAELQAAVQGHSDDGGYIGIYTLLKSVSENYFVH